MPGRKLLTEADWLPAYFGPHDSEMIRRREVLRETIERFHNGKRIEHYQQLAQRNLNNWLTANKNSPSPQQVRVIEGDWGAVTQALTIEFGECFAVLNMANAFVPGGAYVEGAPAQEENIFRRTDCHFSIDSNEYDSVQDCYQYAMTRLILAEHGEVYFDTTPRTCIRGPEDRDRSDLGYAWLDDDQVFPFFELRSAAQDLRDGSSFSVAEAQKRIAAQLDTLIKHNVRHAILGAHGCGAFMNPTRIVADIYHEQISERAENFSMIAFAIFNAGYGPDNFKPFAEQFSEPLLLSSSQP